ncbi:MAG: polynucleotide 5'-hydroxyl-kinase [Anaerolineales bacterium]|jgi:polynucleotide 5'-hydroxyl-kinase GRC3/NOL9
MNHTHKLDIPPEWERLDLSGLSGVLMVIGASDTGKSTFARYLFGRMQRLDRAGRVAFLDGDPGQSSLGPPTTLTVSTHLPEDNAFPMGAGVYRYFIGATSPRGHLLPMLVGSARLAQAAFIAGAHFLVHDTSGFIDAQAGGLALLHAEIDLLQPAAVFALQRDRELEPLLLHLRRSQGTRLVVVKPTYGVQPRDMTRRRGYRQERFSRYFQESVRLEVDWSRMAVWPVPRFSLNRLVALEDRAGFTLGLGIVVDIDRSLRSVTLQTPLASMEGVSTLHIGDLALDPLSYADLKT